jgi:hypothetical protein
MYSDFGLFLQNREYKIFNLFSYINISKNYIFYSLF